MWLRAAALQLEASKPGLSRSKEVAKKMAMLRGSLGCCRRVPMKDEAFSLLLGSLW
jgi:hypothetical protein